MATLSSEDIDAIHADIMRRWSRAFTGMPPSKEGVRALIVSIDGGLNTAETSIFQGLPAGAGKTWLLANQSLGRFAIELTERKRKDVL